MATTDEISSTLSKLDLCTNVYNIKCLSGGSISNAACYSTDKGDYFVKSNASKKASKWFSAEYLALQQMYRALPGFTPRPIHHDNHFIVTEYVSMSNGRGRTQNVTQKELGQQLANLHSTCISNQGFGFDVISFCGTTELDNSWNSNWSQFWRKQRMEPLFNQVRGKNDHLDKLGRELCSRMDHWLGPDVLSNITPVLLHGDLWSGNWAIRSDTGKPFIFDPASYYGHYEAEFGIMKMFGGFTDDFFDKYDTAITEQGTIEIQEEGQRERLVLYELYHHLNHYAMFGGSYGSSCIDLIEELV